VLRKFRPRLKTQVGRITDRSGVFFMLSVVFSVTKTRVCASLIVGGVKLYEMEFGRMN